MNKLEMSDLYPKIVETILGSEYKDDQQQLTTLAILTLQNRISSLSLFALTVKGKRMTDKRRETVTELVSDIVFYSIILLWLNNLDPEVFDFETLTEFSEEFSDDYQTDTILCCNLAMLNSAQLLEVMFDDEEFTDAMAEVTEGEIEIIPEEHIDPTYPPDDEEGQIPDAEAAQNVATLLATAMMVAQQLDTDFDVILYNASILTAEDI